jgi:hypothetical protein
MSTTSLSNTAVAQRLHSALQPLAIVPLDVDLPGEPSVGRVRRRGRSAAEGDIGIVTLLDVDGVLMWEDGAVNASSTMRRRGARTGPSADGDVVTQLKYEKALGLNSINDKLYQLDAQLTPRAAHGAATGSALLEYDQTSWTATPGAVPAPAGRILLLVHGTFSSSDNVMGELRGVGVGPGSFLGKVKAANYDQVLGFDHFTVSRSPMVNAVELARLFSASTAEVDIVCHSRGGLVSRWFCELLDSRTRRRRVVFVGCPFQGTSLADPKSLRHGLDLMTNVGKVLGDAFGLVPFLAAAGGLVQVLSSLGNFAARSPLIDAGIGLLPGIAAMSRIDRNPELNALNHGPAVARADYFAVSSTFQTEAVGWQFWRLFNKWKAADLAADRLVFEQDNDLVVDTSSMTYHAFGPAPNFGNMKTFCQFDASSQVHHTAYFRDPRTLDFIAGSFGF